MKRYLSIIAALTVLLTGCSKDDERQIQTPIDPASDIYGVVADTQGNLLSGVMVSDGFSCNVTDANGVYQLTRNALAYYVFISIPEQYEVPISSGLPCFWQKLDARQRYDFTLSPLAGGVEKDFNLFCIADPQCQNTSHIARFQNETVPDIAARVAEATLPCYGITLGDIGYNTAATDYTNDVFPLMKLAMGQSRTGLPVFQVIGNHDNKVIAVSEDKYTVEHDVAAQRNFELAFGPVNYSFNRGNVHIVAMDNIVFPNHDKYSLGFRDDQLEWLRQDLAAVSKDKMVILCVHIPMRNSSAKNVQAVMDLLGEFASAHIMSGHTHYAENTIDTGRDIFEHVHAAASGAWWNSAVNTDGAPNGYAVYQIKGAEITDWNYKATGHDAGFQIRLYRGDQIFAGNYKFYYTASDQINANIWNADPDWTIEVFENGTKTGEMLPYEDKATKRDAWSSAYHCSVVGRDPKNYDRTNISHLFYYTLRDAAATVEVRATDRFGNVYKQSAFTTASSADYPTY